MKVLFATAFSLTLVAACSGDETPNSGEKACQDLQAKLAECHLTTQGTCNSNEPCAVECAANADCSQLAAGTPTGSYLTCIAACSGAAPDDFICKDGKGFVNKAAVCDGRPQCPDGSDEAACGNADGGGGAPGGSGGSSGALSTGGNAPSGGGGGSGGVSGSTGASPECEAMVDHELVACPTLSRDSELQSCAFDTLLYAPEGCGPAWNSYLQCAAQASWDCNQGPTGCDAQQTSYFDCQSQFTARTGCSRSRGGDSRCAAPTPYDYGCIGSIPSGCVQLPPTGGGTQVCCPQFPAP